jgi:hypothetical protein
MAEKKAVLNVTVSESVAEVVRRIAALEGTTISSVVERALADEVRWELKRREGLAAIDEYYREHGYPTPEEMAEAEARVAEEHRLIDEARAELAAQRQHRGGAGARDVGGASDVSGAHGSDGGQGAA